MKKINISRVFKTEPVKQQVKNSESTILYYNQLIKFGAANDVAYFYRGCTKFVVGDVQGAIADFSNSVAINPGFVRAYTALGLVKLISGDAQGAFEGLNKAIAIDPAFVEAYTNLGIVKYYVNDFQGAFDAFTKAIEIDPLYADAYYNRAMMNFSMGDEDADPFAIDSLIRH